MSRNTSYRTSLLAAVALVLGMTASTRAEIADMNTRKLIDGGPTPTAQLPAPPPNGEMGFVMSDWSYAIYPDGPQACPTGWSKVIRETYLDTIDPAEKARLLRPENEPELTGKWHAYGAPDGKNFCSNYRDFPNRPAMATVQSKFAYGLDLDEGKASSDPYYCARPKFTSPLGEPVNNEAYRAMGCTRQYRNADGGPGEIVVAYHDIIQTGEFTVVMLLRGVDSLVNDNDVEVILSSSDEQPQRSVTGKILGNASFTITKNARWRNVLHGRIVNGVLTTDSHDILLVRKRGGRSQNITHDKGRGNNLDWDLERAKLRLAFRPDGTLEGMVGGYEHPLDTMVNVIGGGRGSVFNAGIDCAQWFNTFSKFADGGRDPKTGQCTRNSAAYQVTAQPAFVFDRPPESSKTAMVTKK